MASKGCPVPPNLKPYLSRHSYELDHSPPRTGAENLPIRAMTSSQQSTGSSAQSLPKPSPAASPPLGAVSVTENLASPALRHLIWLETLGEEKAKALQKLPHYTVQGMELGLSSGPLGSAGWWAENKWCVQEELEELLDGESGAIMLGVGP